MTATTLIKSLRPGEMLIRCADGSLLRTVSGDFRDVPRAATARKLMRRLTALEQGRKR